MYTIHQAANTGVLREHTIRNLVRQREIPFIKTGNRVLLNYDALLDYLIRQ
jgi:excisionase family DNA binding protein